MGEVIKQLVNQNFTGSDMTNNNQFTLINNNSSTTAVVREVFVTGNDIAADKAKLFIDNNNIEVLSTFENAAGTIIIAPSQNMTMKLNTDMVPGSKNTITGLTDFLPLGSSNASYDTLNVVSATSDPNFTLDPSISTGTTKTDNGNIGSGRGSWFNSYSNRYIACKTGNNVFGARFDSNSQSTVYYNNSQVTSDNYNGCAYDPHGQRFFWLENNDNIYMLDPTISSSKIKIAEAFSGLSQSTYGTGAVCTDHNGDVYYFYMQNQTIKVRNITDRGDLSGNQNSSGNKPNWNNTWRPYIGNSRGIYSSHPRVVVAYNTNETKFYVLALDGEFNGDASSKLTTFTLAAYNAVSSTGNISTTDIKNGNGVGSCVNQLMPTAVQSTNQYMWQIEHLGGPYISVPGETTTNAYIMKCENNTLTQVAEITGLDTKGGINTSYNRFVIASPAQAITGLSVVPQAFTPANYVISARVNIQGVEIT